MATAVKLNRRLTSLDPMSLLQGIMKCEANCSGHGECHNGTCICDIRFEGSNCQAPNLPYFVSFSSIFYLVGAVSLVQLVICVRAEFRRLKTPSLAEACRVTTQKFLYVLVFIAAMLRGLYFSSPSNVSAGWMSSLLSAYYPIVLTSSSLLVCFWAEVFHLSDVRWDRPHFLSKSFLGFVTFNVISYSLLVSEFILTLDVSEDEQNFLTHIFNGCYALLMFIVVVFFLIYGVEVYFKVRGGFITEPLTISEKVRQRRCSSPSEEGLEGQEGDPNSEGAAPTTLRLMDGNEDDQVRGAFTRGCAQSVDTAQLHQSRFGLIFQACMLMIIVCFLLSDTLGEFWKYRVPLTSRNCHDVVFRVVELGVALWFPCVLWNCMRPDQLWILNPKKILKKLELEPVIPHEGRDDARRHLRKDLGSRESLPECWICYDADREDAGPLIQPCDCKGDVSIVHHDCLRKWLMECSESSPEDLHCKVCNSVYELQKGRAWLAQGFTTKHWLQTATMVTVMCGSATGAWSVIQVYENVGIRTLAVGVAVLIMYVCMRFLGFNMVTAYHRARVSAVRILGRRFSLSPTASPLRSPRPGPSRCKHSSSVAIISSSTTVLTVHPHPTTSRIPETKL